MATVSGTPAITIKQFAGGATQISPVTVTTTLSVNKLSNMQDVNSSGKSTGDTLVYHADSDTYVVEKIGPDSITEIDGGTF